MKNLKIVGYIEKCDIQDVKETLKGLPIYDTREGCLRALAGYENLKAKKIVIKVTIEGAKK